MRSPADWPALTMVYIVLIAIFVALLVGVAVAASTKNRYTQMTEEEFQAEAERSSLLGAAMLGLHQHLQQKRVEYVIQKDKHVEADRTASGDRPPEELRSEPDKDK